MFNILFELYVGFLETADFAWYKDLDKFKAPSKVIYFLMGWFIIIRANILPELLTWPGTILLLLGGIVYSVGTIFFALGTKVKWMHSIFHIFIVIASILQFLSIVMYVL